MGKNRNRFVSMLVVIMLVLGIVPNMATGTTYADSGMVATSIDTDPPVPSGGDATNKTLSGGSATNKVLSGASYEVMTDALSEPDFIAADSETGDYAFDASIGKLTIKTDDGSYRWRTDENIVGSSYDYYYFVKSIEFLSGVTYIHPQAFRKCAGIVGDIYVPDTVVSIDHYAFEGCTGITGVHIPDSLAFIGHEAFKGCVGIAGDIHIPDSLHEIGDEAFADCYGARIFIGKDIMFFYLGIDWARDVKVVYCHEAFYDSYSDYMPDNTITYPAHVEKRIKNVTATGMSMAFTSSISGTYYYMVCAGDEWHLGVDSDIVKAQGNAEYVAAKGTGSVNAHDADDTDHPDSNEVSIDISGLTKGTQYTLYVIVEDETGNLSDARGTQFHTIGNVTTTDYEFDEPTGTLTVKTNAGTTIWKLDDHITGGIYDYSNVKSIVIQQGVTAIGGAAFKGCTGLSEMPTIPVGVKSIEVSAFEGCLNMTGVANMPDGMISIGAKAFYGCKCLTGLNLSAYSGYIGNNAFEGCSLSGTLIIPDGVTGIGQNAFYECDNINTLDLSDFSGTIGHGAFFGCSGLTGKLTIPSGVISIGSEAFYNCSNITGLELSDFSGRIDDQAFAGCTALTGRVTIPSGVTEIGNRIFEGCGNITDIVLTSPGMPNLHADWAAGIGTTTTVYYPMVWGPVEHIPALPEDAIPYFGSDVKTKDYEFVAVDRTLTIKTNAGSTLWRTDSHIVGNGVPNYVLPIKTIKISFDVTEIGEEAFAGCTDAVDILIPGNVRIIGDRAFFGCTGVTDKFKLPEVVTEIGEEAFAGCTGVTGKFTIPNAVKEIGARAFDGCSNMTIIMTGSKAPMLGEDWARDVKAVYYPNKWGAAATIENMPATAKSYPPILSNVNISELTSTNVVVDFTSDMAGTYYYATLLYDKTVPDLAAEAVKERSGGYAYYQSGTGNIAASETKSLDIPRLMEDYACVIYIVVEDELGNLSKVSKVSYRSAVSNYGHSAAPKYNGNAIDLGAISGLFTVDANAGARTYSIEQTGSETGTGTLSASGKLTVTKIGTFTIGLVTAATTTHEAGGKVTATLTVSKGIQNTPTELGKVNVSVNGASDGKITGLLANKNYEYKEDGATDYIGVTSDGSGAIAGLPEGSYVVRLPDSDVCYASADSAAIVISVGRTDETGENVSSATYPVLAHFDSFEGKGVVTAKIDSENAQFVKLLGSKAEVPATNYKVKQGRYTSITLNESHLKTYANGDYIFTAVFKDGKSEVINLKIGVGNGSGVSAGNDNDASAKTVKVTGIKSLAKIYVVKGKSVKLPVAVRPFNATNKGVTWSVKNKKIAKINAKTGKLKALKKGKTVVTVTSKDGKKVAKCKVYVVNKASKLKKLKIKSKKVTTLSIGKMTTGKLLQVKIKLNPGKATGIVPKYKSSRRAVAVIDATGMITALSPGKTTITVKAGKLKKKFVLNVTK